MGRSRCTRAAAESMIAIGLQPTLGRSVNAAALVEECSRPTLVRQYAAIVSLVTSGRRPCLIEAVSLPRGRWQTKQLRIIGAVQPIEVFH